MLTFLNVFHSFICLSLTGPSPVVPPASPGRPRWRPSSWVFLSGSACCPVRLQLQEKRPTGRRFLQEASKTGRASRRRRPELQLQLSATRKIRQHQPEEQTQNCTDDEDRLLCLFTQTSVCLFVYTEKKPHNGFLENWDLEAEFLSAEHGKHLSSREDQIHKKQKQTTKEGKSSLSSRGCWSLSLLLLGKQVRKKNVFNQLWRLII